MTVPGAVHWWAMNSFNDDDDDDDDDRNA